jgi:hypothetical protein
MLIIPMSSKTSSNLKHNLKTKETKFLLSLLHNKIKINQIVLSPCKTQILSNGQLLNNNNNLWWLNNKTLVNSNRFIIIINITILTPKWCKETSKTWAWTWDTQICNNSRISSKCQTKYHNKWTHLLKTKTLTQRKQVSNNSNTKTWLETICNFKLCFYNSSNNNLHYKVKNQTKACNKCRWQCLKMQMLVILTNNSSLLEVIYRTNNYCSSNTSNKCRIAYLKCNKANLHLRMLGHHRIWG